MWDLVRSSACRDPKSLLNSSSAVGAPVGERASGKGENFLVSWTSRHRENRAIMRSACLSRTTSKVHDDIEMVPRAELAQLHRGKPYTCRPLPDESVNVLDRVHPGCGLNLREGCQCVQTLSSA